MTSDEMRAAAAVMQQPKTPELNKIARVSKQSQKIGDFIEWLSSQGIELCKLHHYSMVPHYEPINDLLARYYKIDNAKAERERKSILKYLAASRTTPSGVEEQTK